MDVTPLTPAAATGDAARTDSARAVRQPASAEDVAFARAVDQVIAQDAAASAETVRAEPAEEPGWKQLETLLVQQMLQSVMTSEEGGFFGEGLGSDYYASFMAEQFGARLAEGLDLGIASRLEGLYGSGDGT
ncbi:MAG: hypothetical protein JJ920_00665 [Roseitalea sp.]|jgi:Rod binding domain-containing protein|nr:hypothetical protein [Roseitalea sp.]MBO6741390.1 hypothetical protein [Roseitalea sp.]